MTGRRDHHVRSFGWGSGGQHERSSDLLSKDSRVVWLAINGRCGDLGEKLNNSIFLLSPNPFMLFDMHCAMRFHFFF